jgi:hypothetical protein
MTDLVRPDRRAQATRVLLQARTVLETATWLCDQALTALTTRKDAS